jgi:hypothetical protein
MTLTGRCFLNSCIIVNSIEPLADFVSLVFDEVSYQILTTPIKHATIKLSDDCQALFVQKSSCSKQQLKFLQTTSVTHVALHSKNAAEIQRSAIAAGAKMITKMTDDIPTCVIQGPENILFIVSLRESSEQKAWFYDYILDSLPALGVSISSPLPNFAAASRKGLGMMRLGASRNPEVRARSLSPAAVRNSAEKDNKKVKSINLQLSTDININTSGTGFGTSNAGSDNMTARAALSNSTSIVSVVGDGSVTPTGKKESSSLASLPIFGPPLTTIESALYFAGQDHVVFPPNTQEPVPFETDFFKGYAMLVVRTEPIVPQFTQFFAGKR